MKQILIIGFILITTLLWGCATTKYSNVNLLDNYNSTNNGSYVKSVWINNSKIKSNETFKIFLEEINIDNISDEKGITKIEGKNVLKNSIMNSQYNNGILVTKDDTSDYSMALAITNMSPGDRASRMWAGELGFGHANVELQVIITNKESERVIEIKDSQSNSGAIGFRDIPEDSGPQLVRELLQAISDNILQELNSIINNH